MQTRWRVTDDHSNMPTDARYQVVEMADPATRVTYPGRGDTYAAREAIETLQAICRRVSDAACYIERMV